LIYKLGHNAQRTGRGFGVEHNPGLFQNMHLNLCEVALKHPRCAACKASNSRREANGALLGGLLCTYRVKTKDSVGGTRPSRFPEKKEHAADFRLMLTGLKSVFGEN
jgi:hypothetical protein